MGGEKGVRVKMKFLIIDDESTVRQLIGLLLKCKFSNSEVRYAGTNSEAFTILKSFRPNLIITDIMRPEGDGYDFLEKLRSHPRTQHIPVMVISANSQSNEDQIKQFKHGFNFVIKKPFRANEVIEGIEKLLAIKVDPDLSLVYSGYESRGLDYKGLLNLKLKAVKAGLAKDVISIANSGGGLIIIGVSEPNPGEFIPEGIPKEFLGEFETSRLNRAIRDFIDPPVHIKSRRVHDDDKIFVFLEIPPAAGVLILANRKNESANLYPGRIYSRTSAAESSEVQNSSELRTLMERAFRSSDNSGDRILI